MDNISLSSSSFMKNKKSLIKSREELFLEEKERELSENEELEYDIKNTNSTTPSPSGMIADGWLKISSEEFKNIINFPTIEINGKRFNIKTDQRNFRININYDSKKTGEDFPKTNIDFYFRLVKNLIYYTVDKKDLNIVGSIEINSVNEKTLFLPGQELDGLCFTVNDKGGIPWDMCAEDKKTADNFICKIKSSLGINCNQNQGLEKSSNNTNTTTYKNSSLETETYQPIIVIPVPANECNMNWDYSLKGNNWECGCNEGAEQSPIDIPDISNVIESSASPYFTFNNIEAKSPVTSIDGELKTQENIKIKYFKNAIRILHNDIGKIVTLDGSVYIGEEIVFHTPAEHKINGKKMDMEMQIIYYGRSKGDIAKQVVLSFLFQRRAGVYNKFLEDLDIFNLPNETNPVKEIKNNLYIPKIFYNSDEDMDLKAKPFSFYTYQGSLTMPPCSEGTIHYVISEPIPLGSVVIQLFREALKKENSSENGLLNNSRKTQPLNGRKVFYFNQGNNDVNLDVPNNERSKAPVTGHYEKFRKTKTMYQWINNSSPSRYPGAILVPDKDAQKILNLN